MPIKSAKFYVDVANKLSSQELSSLSDFSNEEAIVEVKGKEKNEIFIFEVHNSQEIEKQDRGAILQLCKENMRAMYENTPGGWNAQSKEDELFDTLSRFLIVRKNDDKSIVAFTMWRFDQEFCDSDDPVARKGKRKIEVVYCYEIQVYPPFRQFGLGKFMMNRLETLAKKTKMRKVMLTVFKSNTNARQFYDRLGFKVEYSTPEQTGSHHEQDQTLLDELGEYVILGKATIS